MASTGPGQPQHKATTVIIKKDNQEPDGVRFRFKNAPGNGQKQTYDNDGHPGLLVDFTIEDVQGTGLLFPVSKDDAMWVHEVQNEQGPCPPEGSHWPVFSAVEVLDGGKTLRVRNTNPCNQLFKFSLNFTRDRSDPKLKLVCWDPIGQNRNGSTSQSSANSISSGTVLTIGAVAVAVVALAALAWPKG